MGHVWWFRTRTCLIGIVAVGAALRLWQYFGNPSLNLDELALARNIVERPLRKLLFTPLFFAQVAPQGFLLTEKAVAFALGDSEYALRLWPLLCSLASVVLCWRVSLEVLQGFAGPCALILFAFKPAFVLYGATLKQYSTDTVAVLLVILLAVKLGTRGATWPQHLLIGAIGMVVAQWSHAAVLTLLGVGWASIVSALVKWDMRRLRQLSLTIALWAVGGSMAVVMGLQSMTAATYTYMRLYWREGFVPWRSASHGENMAMWLWTGLYEFFDLERLHTAWYEWPGLYIGLVVFGLWSLWCRRRDACLIFLGPVVIALTAAMAHQYPFKGRPAMFLTPIFLMLAAEGVVELRRISARRFPVMATACMIILVLIPLYDSITNLPVYRREEIKPLLAHVEAQYLPGDALYVYYGAWQAVSFYAAWFGFHDHEYTIGGCHRGNPRAYLHELDQFRGRPRLWVVIAHAMPRLQELPVIIGYLDRIGVRRDHVFIPAQIWDKKGVAPHLGDAYAYLYDLSDEARLSSTTAETFAVASSAKPPLHFAFGCQAGPHVPLTTEIFR